MAHIVVFAGEYDLAKKSDLRKELSRLGSLQDVVLDVSEVTFIDSTFISELISLENMRKNKRLSPITVVASRKCLVRRLFEVTGLLSRLNVVEYYSPDNDASAGSTVQYANTGRTA